MPAPKNPNTAKATGTNRRRGQETKAISIHGDGWVVIPPEHAGSQPVFRTDDKDHALHERNRNPAPWCAQCMGDKAVPAPEQAGSVPHGGLCTGGLCFEDDFTDECDWA